MKDIAKNVGNYIHRNSPTILTGIGVVGFVSSAVMAVKATPKALTILEFEFLQREHGDSVEDRYVRYDYDQIIPSFSAKEIVGHVWRLYLPSVLMGAVSTAAIIGAQRVGSKRTAALASLYSISEKTLAEYQNKVAETIGENKERAIRDVINEETIEKNPVSNQTVIVSGNGDVLFYDKWSGRYFNSTMESIKQAQNEFNKELIDDFWCTLNDFYDLINLDRIDMGDQIGWNTDKLMELQFSAHVTTDDKPCIVMDFAFSPPTHSFR